MPQYAPLPPIELDPRSESELVAAAAQRVYEASGATINDFSSGSPVLALLEGQAFAQAEFLAFANTFPEAVLVEWIGPFLGAQRRTGAGAVVDIEFTISPRSQEFVVFPGFELSTDSNLTGGQQISFVTAERLSIPAGEETGLVRAVALLRGVAGNVPANTITSAVTSLAGVLSVTNPEPAVGGSDPELLSEAKERFFTLIRRRNPVSAEDWVNFFSDALGAGTAVNVLPRRSERDTYRYGEGSVEAAPAVAFFVLNPDGTALTSGQRSALQNLTRFSLPTEFEGTVYSMDVDDVDIFITLSYDPTKPYSQDLRAFSRTVRDNLFGIMTPNAVFPISYEPNVTDLEGSLATALPLTLGVETQYIDPDILALTAYHPPSGISSGAFPILEPKPFKTGSVFKEGDIVVNSTGIVPLYFPVTQDFSPTTGDKAYHANIGDLKFKLIRPLSLGEFKTGDVIFVESADGGTLHVVRADFTYRGDKTPAQLIQAGEVTPARGFSVWQSGTEIKAFNTNREYDPQLLAFDPSDISNEVYEPRLPERVMLQMRPGYPVWVAEKDFVVSSDLFDLGTAQLKGFVGTRSVDIELLLPEKSYESGQFIKTPSQEQFLAGEVTEDSCYISELRGVEQLYARVLQDFTYPLDEDRTLRIVFDELVNDGIIEIINVVEYLDCAGRPLFKDAPFRYRSRFSLGEYIRYRPRGGFNAQELEDCTVLASACDSLPDSCKRLIEANLPLPRYFQALVDFTPDTDDMDELVAAGFVEEVSSRVFRYDYTVSLSSLPTFFSKNDLTQALIDTGAIQRPEGLVPGQIVRILGPVGENLGSFFWSSFGWEEETRGIPSFRDIFRFAPGDVARFRNGTVTRQYEAKAHLTPILDLEVYYDNGLFERSQSSETVKYFDPRYRYEDVIVDDIEYSKRFYRVLRSFTPEDTVTTWAGQVPNTPRAEEVFGNLKKFVVRASGSERIKARLGLQIGTTKLGSATLTVTSKNNTLTSQKFVWESTRYPDEPTQLSFYTGTSFKSGPVNYGDGTLAL